MAAFFITIYYCFLEHLYILILEQAEGLFMTTKKVTKMIDTITNEFGETFKKVLLKSLKQGDEFKRQPNAKKSFYKGHYNRKSYFQKTPTFTCVHDQDIYGGGVEINAAAFVYVDSTGPVNYKAWL